MYAGIHPLGMLAMQMQPAQHWCLCVCVRVCGTYVSCVDDVRRHGCVCMYVWTILALRNTDLTLNTAVPRRPKLSKLQGTR